jgi:UDP-N-acetylmuramate dehydrogenase
MVNVREQVMLSGFTTLGLGGPARRFVAAGTDEEIIAAVRGADERGEPVLVLGGGSNLVIADGGFAGTVVHLATKGIRREADGGPVAVTVAAGEDWDAVVTSCVAAELSGLECLSGIPGLAGATPIQNVGAYGQEVAQTITSVRAYDRASREVVDLPAEECGFGYRTSAFKRSSGSRFVVLAVTFRLLPDPLSRPVRYGELAQALGVGEGGRAPLGDVRAAVLRLRRRKGMVLDPDDPDTRSAGSFFTNPILSLEQFAVLQGVILARCGPAARIPQFPADAGHVKVSAAWLIGQAGFRTGYPGNGRGPGDGDGDGHRHGDEGGHGDGGAAGGLPGARISTKHTLALVNPGGASTASLLALAREIRDGVRDVFGVELASEPVVVGDAL